MLQVSWNYGYGSSQCLKFKEISSNSGARSSWVNRLNAFPAKHVFIQFYDFMSLMMNHGLVILVCWYILSMPPLKLILSFLCTYLSYLCIEFFDDPVRWRSGVISSLAPSRRRSNSRVKCLESWCELTTSRVSRLWCDPLTEVSSCHHEIQLVLRQVIELL